MVNHFNSKNEKEWSKVYCLKIYLAKGIREISIKIFQIFFHLNIVTGEVKLFLSFSIVNQTIAFTLSFFRNVSEVKPARLDDDTEGYS